MGTVFIYGVNLFLLPIILSFLPQKELGLWYTFASVSTLIQLVNLGFSPCIMRNVGHVWGGLQRIDSEGIKAESHSHKINYELLSNVLKIAKEIYFFIALIVFILVCIPGSIYIHSVLEDIDPVYGIGSWLLYGIGISINMMYSYWDSVLKGVGGVSEAHKANIIAKLGQLLISYIGLFMGYGLWALALAHFASGFIMKFCSRSYCARIIGKDHVRTRGRCFDSSLRSTIIKNAFKFGIISLATQMVAQSFQMIITSAYGLNVSAQYGLTVQLLNVIVTVSYAYFTAVLPEINMQRVSPDFTRRKELVSVSAWVQWIAMALGIAALSLFGKPVLRLFSKADNLLPTIELLLLSTIYFVETNRLLFTTYISTSNSLPYTKAIVISSSVTVVLSFLAAIILKCPLIVIIILRLCVEMCYNGWKWMNVVLQELETSVFEMMKLTYKKVKSIVH